VVEELVAAAVDATGIEGTIAADDRRRLVAVPASAGGVDRGRAAGVGHGRDVAGVDRRGEEIDGRWLMVSVYAPMRLFLSLPC